MLVVLPLIEKVSHQAVLLHGGYLLPSADFRELFLCKAAASEVHDSCPLGTFPCSSFSGCNSVHKVKHEAQSAMLNAARFIGTGVSEVSGGVMLMSSGGSGGGGDRLRVVVFASETRN